DLLAVDVTAGRHDDCGHLGERLAVDRVDQGARDRAKTLELDLELRAPVFLELELGLARSALRVDLHGIRARLQPAELEGTIFGAYSLAAWHRSGERNRVLRDLLDRKSTRLNSSHVKISYAVFCLKKKN